MRDYEKGDKLYARLVNAFLKNYDELITELEYPEIALDLTQGNFEVPEYAKKSLNLPDDAFVDELFADTNEDCDELYGIVLHLAVLKDDCVEVVDEFDIEELEDDYYEKLVEYAEHHKGLHIKD